MLWKKARATKADIVCVQETHFKASSPLRLQNRKFPRIFTANSVRKKAGVLIAIKDSITLHSHCTCMDPGGRFIILVCDINNVPCTIVNVYAHNTRQFSFLNKVRKKVHSIRKDNLLWCGDFNAIVDASIDTTSTSPTPPIQLTLGLSKIWSIYSVLHLL